MGRVAARLHMIRMITTTLSWNLEVQWLEVGSNAWMDIYDFLAFKRVESEPHLQYSTNRLYVDQNRRRRRAEAQMHFHECANKRVRVYDWSKSYRQFTYVEAYYLLLRSLPYSTVVVGTVWYCWKVQYLVSTPFEKRKRNGSLRIVFTSLLQQQHPPVSP